jgi:S-DNA-T family DNA segregation ATPase FtsK/SpoIIIE
MHKKEFHVGRSKGSKSGSGNNASRKAASPSVKHAQKQADSRRASSADDGENFLDERSRLDIWGVICAVVGIALLVVCVMPSNALVSTALGQVLHLGLGMGAYILPVVLLLISVSLFVRNNDHRVPKRIAVGLFIMFFALLVLLSLYSPGVTPTNAGDVLFTPVNLKSQGGYIGAGIAWIGMTLFGQMVSTIIVVGIMIIALIIVGFSISRIVDRIRSHHDQAESYDATEEMPQAVSKRPSVFVKKAAPHKRSARSALSDAPTQLITDKKTSPKRSRKLSDLQKTRSMDALADAKNGSGNDSSAAAAMTRRLGHHDKDATQVLSRSKKAGGTVATPHPSEGFILPDMSLLKKTDQAGDSKETEATLHDTAMLLQETLADFNVNAQVVGWVAGPTVTLFKIDLPAGVRVSRVTNLQDDLALALAAPGVRIFAPIPGTNYVGIEVPNVKRQNVLLGDVLPSAGKGPLQIAIGKDVEGHCIVSDLSKMPHLLIGGTTGSGKSVAINSMIMSILMRATPAEVRFIMIDPKRVEFTPYNGIPHLYVPVVTECREAASALSWGVAEMERRLKVFSKVGARNINQYNAKVQKGMQIGDADAQELPYIVIVIDELADLMMNVGKEVELSISRLAQLARAAGIHMIVATQRPSAKVVTGLIKANITNRIAFNVASGIDSRVILDTPGAESLIGLGDLLFSKPEIPKPIRLQGCYVSEQEIESVVSRLKEQGEPDYHQEILKTNLIEIGSTAANGSSASGSPDDPLLWEAADIVVNSGLGSTSNLQRRLSVGYSRAGRIMDMLEEKGVVGPPNGSKPREVMIDALELESLKAFEQNDKAAESGE